jgi:Arc/MetJ-type ribon-helix-helix transcriptional regulator
MEIINVRFDEELISRLDELVAKGVFKNRSQALRSITKDFLDNHPQLFPLGRYERRGGGDMGDSELEEVCAEIFSGPSTASELIGEGRGR